MSRVVFLKETRTPWPRDHQAFLEAITPKGVVPAPSEIKKVRKEVAAPVAPPVPPTLDERLLSTIRKELAT